MKLLLCPYSLNVKKKNYFIINKFVVQIYENLHHNLFHRKKKCFGLMKIGENFHFSESKFIFFNQVA